MAIKGELVNPNAEDAKQLLDNIKVKPITENVPYDLPWGWCWTRIKDIATFSGGKTPSMANKE